MTSTIEVVMMAVDPLITDLTRLGLNMYEAKAYLTLLGKASFTAAQVADKSGVPRQRIYDILGSLVERGLASSRLGKQHTKYVAAAPAVALSSLLAREQKRVAELEVVTGALISTLNSHYMLGQGEHGPLEYIEVLRGRAAINERFAEILATCKHELLIFTKPPYAKPVAENIEGLETLKRQIRARSLYEYRSLDSAEARETISYFVERGEEARVVDELPLKLVIVDEEIVMFAMEDPGAGHTDLTIMVVEQQQLARLMKLAFNAVWNRGESFEAACARLAATGR